MTWAARIPTLAGLRYPQASFVLDFANNYYRGSGAQGSSPSALPGYNFTRALAAYAEDTSGKLIQFASGVPRITNKGVLIEEGRTNVLQWSGDQSNAWWMKLNVSTSAGPTGPDGLTASTTLTVTGSGSAIKAVYRLGGLVYASGTTYTTSWVVKPGAGVRYVQLPLWSPIFSNGYANFDLQAGVVGTTSAGVTSRISRLSGGWFLISATGTAGASATGDGGYVFIVDAPDATFAPASSAASGSVLYTWAAQLEAGSFATSYIPTTSASVTRPADVFYYSGLSVSNVSTIAGAGLAPQLQINIGRIAEISDGGGQSLNVGAGNSIRDAYVGGSGLTSAPVGDAVTFGAPTISVASNASGTVRGSGNGKAASALVGTSTITTATRVTVGDVLAASRPLNGYVQRLVIYPFAASDAQLQSISSGNF